MESRRKPRRRSDFEYTSAWKPAPSSDFVYFFAWKPAPSLDFVYFSARKPHRRSSGEHFSAWKPRRPPHGRAFFRLETSSTTPRRALFRPASSSMWSTWSSFPTCALPECCQAGFTITLVCACADTINNRALKVARILFMCFLILMPFQFPFQLSLTLRC